MRSQDARHTHAMDEDVGLLITMGMDQGVRPWFYPGTFFLGGGNFSPKPRNFPPKNFWPALIFLDN